jgi:prolyl oligopeptidase
MAQSRLTLTLPVLALAFASSTLALAATVAGVEVSPPLAAQNVTEVHWGVEVSDPYRRLENVSDPEVRQWLRAQADATAAVLARIPGRKAMLDRIKEIEGAAGGTTTSVVRTDGGRLFYLRRNADENQFKLVWRDGPNGADHMVFDPEAAGQGGQPHAVMDFAPSRDGRKLAYSVQAGGGEIGTLHVIDLASGREIVSPIDRIRYASVSWLDDGSGFFYSRLREGYEKLPPTQRFGDRTRHYRALDAAGTDRAIMSPSRNPELGLPGYASPFVFQVHGTRTAAAVVVMGVDPNRMLLVADLDAARAGKAQWRKVVDTSDQVTSITESGGWFYLKSAKDAPRYKVLRMPVARPELARAELVVPAGEGAIGDVAGARDGLYFTRREGVNTSLYRLPRGAKARIERVTLPFAGSVDIKSTSPRRDGAVLGMVGWTRAFKDYVYEPAARSVSLLPLAKDGAYDAPPDIEAREVMVRSHDGVMVPLSIVSRKDVKLDGSNPTILYGYGAYGSPDDPFFSPRVYAWIARGGVWATAHVRGGGVFGKEWHEAGRKATKPNTWKDAIAAGDWLVANGWTKSERMAIYGGSAGGIFVGRAITERPELFAAAVPAVGVMDTVRAETSANGVANIPEFGTVKKEDEFKALLAMSSYHHLRDGAKYPAVMALHGVNDIRVDVWQSAKFASRLAAATTSGKPVLMRLEYDSGHGQGSTRAQAQERSTDIWSFLLWQFGVPQYQPE